MPQTLFPFTHAQQKERCLEIIRGFLADETGVRAGIEFVGHRRQIASLLEHEMDLLTPKERYRVYGFIEGMLPRNFQKILKARLDKESDPKCLELIRAILEIHAKG